MKIQPVYIIAVLVALFAIYMLFFKKRFSYYTETEGAPMDMVEDVQEDEKME